MMELAGLAIVIILFVIAGVAALVIGIIVCVVLLIKRISRHQSVKLPVIVLLCLVAVFLLVFMANKSSHDRQKAFERSLYSNFPYTVYYPAKLPSGYENRSSSISTNYAIFPLSHGGSPVQILELPISKASGYFNPPNTCNLSNLYGSVVMSDPNKTPNDPCITDPSGIYIDSQNYDYAAVQKDNTVVVFQQKNIKEHLADLSKINQKLEPQ